MPLAEIENWYINERMSAKEIAEQIENKYKKPISRQTVHFFIKKNFSTRRHSESMRNRVVTGRMNYKDLKIDYDKREIDYAEIWHKRSPDFTGQLKNPKTRQVSLPQPYVDKIKTYAKQRKLTIKETILEIFPSLAGKYERYILRPLPQAFERGNKARVKETLTYLDQFFKEFKD